MSHVAWWTRLKGFVIYGSFCERSGEGFSSSGSCEKRNAGVRLKVWNKWTLYTYWNEASLMRLGIYFHAFAWWLTFSHLFRNFTSKIVPVVSSVKIRGRFALASLACARFAFDCSSAKACFLAPLTQSEPGLNHASHTHFYWNTKLHVSKTYVHLNTAERESATVSVLTHTSLPFPLLFEWVQWLYNYNYIHL